MAQAFRKYSSAKKAAEGQPVIRVSDLYIAGVTETDEVCTIAASGAITSHITMRHLDRLGNGNYAIETQPTPNYAYPKPTTDRIGLAMHHPEAVALWGLLDAVLAGQSAGPYVEENSEKLRWTRDRLARVVADYIQKNSSETANK